MVSLQLYSKAHDLSLLKKLSVGKKKPIEKNFGSITNTRFFFIKNYIIEIITHNNLWYFGLFIKMFCDNYGFKQCWLVLVFKSKCLVGYLIYLGPHKLSYQYPQKNVSNRLSNYKSITINYTPIIWLKFFLMKIYNII